MKLLTPILEKGYTVIVTAMIIFFTAASLQAQWQVGVKASLGYIPKQEKSLEVIPKSDFIVYDIMYMGNTTASSIGLMAINDLGPVFFQTDVLFTNYSVNFHVTGYDEYGHYTNYYKDRYYTLELPISAGVNIDQFRIGVGPVFEINMDKESQMSALPMYNDELSTLQAGFQGSIGYQVGLLHLELRYINKFNSVTDDFSFGVDNLKSKSSANRMTFSVGIAF